MINKNKRKESAHKNSDADKKTEPDKRPLSAYRQTQKPSQTQPTFKDSQYKYLTSNNIPAGRYHATIDKAELSRTRRTKKEAVDVYFTGIDEQGKTKLFWYRIPMPSYFLDDFFNALNDAGFSDEEIDVDVIVGTKLGVEIVYPEGNDYGDVTYFQVSTDKKKTHHNSRPSTLASIADDEEDDEDEDELVDEDDLELAFDDFATEDND